MVCRYAVGIVIGRLGIDPGHEFRPLRRLPGVLPVQNFARVRALLSSTRGSGQSRAISRYGTYGLHAKLYVMDRQRFYIGSMNYDQRSWRINTEIGLIIESREIAEEVAHRFEAMVSPDAAYRVILNVDSKGRPELRWTAEIDHRKVEFTHEPSRGFWQRTKVEVLGLLPIEREL